MDIYLNINFNADGGMFVCKSVDGNEFDAGTGMTASDGGNWSARLVCDGDRIRYRYYAGGECRMYECGSPHIAAAAAGCRRIVCRDQWQGCSGEAPLLSAPFTDTFYRREAAEVRCEPGKVLFILTLPAVPPGSGVLLCGDCGALGGWDPDKAVRMVYAGESRWAANVSARGMRSIRYKFIISGPQGYVWEEGDDRGAQIPVLGEDEAMILRHCSAKFAGKMPRFSGTAVPVFSLRSRESYGIGDFNDIKAMARWAASTGQSVLQLLPVNDTTSTGTWRDSYPYSCISVMALHPIYLNPALVGDAADPELEAERLRLNALPEIDYEGVLALKDRYSRILFRRFGAACAVDPDYAAFRRDNDSWLLPYAAFCTLRDKFGTADFRKWDPELRRYCPQKVEALFGKEPHLREEAMRHIFIQYHLDRQLSAAVRCAHEAGVAVKGDIPIGITPCSVEAWSEPELFNMDSQAGAPPDAFARRGQNWGFPTYNWERMEKDGFAWWKKRFGKMSRHFGIYRIDHVLGFFRIWEIPSSEISGLLGHFSPALPLSGSEIVSRGFAFRAQRDASPYIDDALLAKVFPDRDSKELSAFLSRRQDGTYAMREGFRSQREIAASPQAADPQLRSGLQALLEERLFVEDPRRPGFYHPRIDIRSSYPFSLLAEEEKQALGRIYDEFYYSRHEDFWRGIGRRRLPEMVSCTGMLACAEDLGMIPACVPEVLSELKILSLEVQRMPKRPGERFADVSSYPYLSVCTTGTHDTSTLRGWWEEERGEASAFWKEVLKEDGEAPLSCPAGAARRIVAAHLCSPSMLAIFPLQDWLAACSRTYGVPAAAERINIPSDPDHYWRYRMPVTIEELAADTGLRSEMLELTSLRDRTTYSCLVHAH